MHKFYASYAKYVPIAVPVILIAVQALLDSGALHLSAQTISLVDVVLAAFGLHALHVRTK